MSWGREYFAAQHDRGRNVAHLRHSEPRHRLLQGNYGRSGTQCRRIRHAHQLTRQRGIRLNQPRKRDGIGGILRGELGQLRADARHGRNILRIGQRFAQEGVGGLGMQGRNDNSGLETHFSHLSDDLVRPHQIGTDSGCLSRKPLLNQILCKINMLTKGLIERLQQIVPQVTRVFNAYREAHGAFTHQRLCALLGGVVAAVQ